MRKDASVDVSQFCNFEDAGYLIGEAGIQSIGTTTITFLSSPY